MLPVLISFKFKYRYDSHRTTVFFHAATARLTTWKKHRSKLDTYSGPDFEQSVLLVLRAIIAYIVSIAYIYI
jgi:hypothetical protein